MNNEKAVQAVRSGTACDPSALREADVDRTTEGSRDLGFGEHFPFIVFDTTYAAID